MSICEHWGSQAPLGAAKLYREGSCCCRLRLLILLLRSRSHCLPLYSHRPGLGLSTKSPESASVASLQLHHFVGLLLILRN